MSNIDDMMAKAKKAFSSSNEEVKTADMEKFVHIWNVVLNWMCLNSKKKMTAKVKHRLTCLHSLKESLYSAMLPNTGGAILHCMELISLGMKASTDEEFIDDAGGFTIAETCSMVARFNQESEEGAVAIARYCISNNRLIDFLRVSGVDQDDFPDVPAMLLEAVESADLPGVELAAIDLNGEFSAVFGEKYNALKNGIGSNIALNNSRGISSVDDMALTMVTHSILSLTCKLCTFPVVQDAMASEKAVGDVVNVHEMYESKKKAEVAIDKVLEGDDDKKSCNLVVGLLAGEFAVNNVVSLWELGKTMPDLDMIKSIYNDAGLLLHDGDQQKLISADWSEYAVGFYNYIAEYYLELAGVHEDVSEELSVLVKGKKEKDGIIDRILSENFVIKDSYKFMRETMPALALSVKGKMKIEETAVHKKKKRKGKKLS